MTERETFQSWKEKKFSCLKRVFFSVHTFKPPADFCQSLAYSQRCLCLPISSSESCWRSEVEKEGKILFDAVKYRAQGMEKRVCPLRLQTPQLSRNIEPRDAGWKIPRAKAKGGNRQPNVYVSIWSISRDARGRLVTENRVDYAENRRCDCTCLDQAPFFYWHWMVSGTQTGWTWQRCQSCQDRKRPMSSSQTLHARFAPNI